MCKTDSYPLACVIPTLDLPEEFLNLTDASLSFPYNDFSVDSSPVTAYNDRNSTLEFSEIVVLDGVAYQWWNETFDLQFFSLLPTINDSGHTVYDGTPLNIWVRCIHWQRYTRARQVK